MLNFFQIAVLIRTRADLTSYTSRLAFPWQKLISCDCFVCLFTLKTTTTQSPCNLCSCLRQIKWHKLKKGVLFWVNGERLDCHFLFYFSSSRFIINAIAMLLTSFVKLCLIWLYIYTGFFKCYSFSIQWHAIDQFEYLWDLIRTRDFKSSSSKHEWRYCEKKIMFFFTVFAYHLHSYS